MCRDSIEKSYYFSTWLNAPIQILPTMPTIPSMCLCLLCLLCPSSWYAKILHSIKHSIVLHPHAPVLSAQYYVSYCAQYYAHGVYMHSRTHADCPPDQVIMGTDFIHRAGMPIALEPSTQGPLKSDWMIFGIFIDAQAPITGALVCHMVHHTTNSLLIVHFAL